MAAGLYLTRHMDILERACRITAEYIPRDADQLDVVEPYKHSMQTSRRFIGLKIFLSLAVAGWSGYAEVIRHQVAMGDLLRSELSLSQWQIVNETELPVVCFVDNQDPSGKSALYLEEIARQVVYSGRAWISPTRLDQSTPVLRACITNYRTTPEDIAALVQVLDKARRGMNE
jgi:glutamate/tyrosine decarboxylase-like PLP-dependent enzyme